jgi:hypothetical protein
MANFGERPRDYLSLFTFFFFLVVLRFELKVSCLLA